MSTNNNVGQAKRRKTDNSSAAVRNEGRQANASGIVNHDNDVDGRDRMRRLFEHNQFLSNQNEFDSKDRNTSDDKILHQPEEQANDFNHHDPIVANRYITNDKRNVVGSAKRSTKSREGLGRRSTLIQVGRHRSSSSRRKSIHGQSPYQHQQKQRRIRAHVNHDNDNDDNNNDNCNDNNNGNDNDAPPTGKDISLALCKIEDSDKYSHDEIMKALQDLKRWLYAFDNQKEAGRVITEFVDRGGIPRMLDFIKENRNGTRFMLCASNVLWMLFLRRDLDNTNVTQKFLERGGVEIMLSLINQKNNNSELDTSELNTLQNIWRVLCNIIIDMNKQNMIDIDKTLPIIDSGISSMCHLNNIGTYNDAAATLKIKKKIFIVLGRFMKYNAEMIEVDDFHEKNVFLKCVYTLKNPVNNSWMYNEGVWGVASLFFHECCKQNRKFLSRKADYETIIPFLIHFIEEDPNHTTHNLFAFDILHKASVTIGKKKMTKSKDLLKVLGAVADGGNKDVRNDVQSSAISFMKCLFDSS